MRTRSANLGLLGKSCLWLALCWGGHEVRAQPGAEYAAGEATLPFAYTATVSAAPRPGNLDFAEEHGSPDNCQLLVRIDGELWQFQMRYPKAYPVITPPARYKGPDIDHMTRQEDATWPAGYHLGWFLGGMWYDDAERKLYAPMHIEAEAVNRDGPVAPWPARKVILVTSTDKGKTWHDEGDIVAPETYFYNPDIYKFAGECSSNGLCDYGFYTDVRGGYFYLFPREAWLTKGSWYSRWSTRAARCAIKDKMASGKWKFFYNGAWNESALGGKSSVVAPVIWGVIYSEFLKGYLCLFPSNRDPADEGGIDGMYMGFCTDLAKQDWVWARCPEAQFGFVTVTNGAGTDIISCDNHLRLYSYFNGNKYQRLDLVFRPGRMTGPDVQPRYSFDPHPESSDAILGRQTKFVGTASGDVSYAGGWVDQSNPAAFEGHFKECSASGSASLTFTGSSVYWRAVRSPDSGKADVYIDRELRKTVDCYSPQSTEYEDILYFLTGLSPHIPHTIKIVAHGEKNALAKGTSIRHVGFEYEAESYRASAGFCSIRGKCNWNYQEWDGPSHEDMHFRESAEVLTNFWFGTNNQVGPNYQVVNAGAAVREWTAPHDGTIRIESRIVIDMSGDPVFARILRNGAELWPEHPLAPGLPLSHDLTAQVQQGDRIYFVVSRNDTRTDISGHKITWDPVVTYTQSSPPTWQANLPSGQNLALGKYARSKRLFHAYKPFNAVDGSRDSFFALSDADKVTSGGDDWLMVDLDKTYLVNRYVVLSDPPAAAWRLRTFTLQKSDNGVVWADVDSVDSTSGPRTERSVPAFKARYVRLYLPHGRPFCINEFELYYGGAAPAPQSIPHH